MSNDREFVTIEQKPRWPALAGCALVGAVITGLVLAVMRGGGEPKVEEATAAIAAKLTPDTQKLEAASAQLAQLAAAPQPQQPADPNLIRGTDQAREAMVPAAVVDRYKERAVAAEKKAKALQGELASLKQQVRALSDEKEAIRRAQLPPPPTEAEEVLNMLAPVLAGKVR